MLRFRQPSRTAMTCPALPVRLIEPHLVQMPACIRLEAVHHPFWWDFRFHHCVHVIGSNMARQEMPVVMPAYLLNGFQHRVAPDRIQVVGGLIHAFCRSCGAGGVHVEDRRSWCIMLAIDRTRFAAVKVASIAGEGNQVNHRFISDFNAWQRSLTVAARHRPAYARQTGTQTRCRLATLPHGRGSSKVRTGNAPSRSRLVKGPDWHTLPHGRGSSRVRTRQRSLTVAARHTLARQSRAVIALQHTRGSSMFIDRTPGLPPGLDNPCC